jgi:membrane-associated phospholipid phosphatase
MSIGEQIKRSSSLPRKAGEGGRRRETMAAGWGWLRDNVLAYLALLRRKPRPLRAAPATLLELIVWTAAIVLIGAAMYFVDARAVGIAQRLPAWLIALADELTDFGRATWILVPTGGLLVLIAVLASAGLSRISQHVLAAGAVKLSFLFTACALPGLMVTTVKRLIGRARPLVDGSANPFLYHPFGWKVEYAGMPSGHATNAFAAAVAIGALWPRARPFMWAYAIVIALTRVALTAHFPSDVLAGAFVGVGGALLVRRWFAARRLAFFQNQAGLIIAQPGPSISRLKRVAGQLFR